MSERASAREGGQEGGKDGGESMLSLERARSQLQHRVLAFVVPLPLRRRCVDDLVLMTLR